MIIIIVEIFQKWLIRIVVLNLAKARDMGSVQRLRLKVSNTGIRKIQ